MADAIYQTPEQSHPAQCPGCYKVYTVRGRWNLFYNEQGRLDSRLEVTTETQACPRCGREHASFAGAGILTDGKL